MGHRHIAEQHYYEQVTRKIAKKARAAKALQSSASLPTATPINSECDSLIVDVLPIEQSPNTGSVSHEQAKEKAATKTEAVPNAPSICRFCGITTSRVKAHERQCQRSKTSLIASEVTISSEPT